MSIAKNYLLLFIFAIIMHILDSLFLGHSSGFKNFWEFLLNCDILLCFGMVNFFETILQWMFALPKTWSYLSTIRYYITSCRIFFLVVFFTTIRKIIFIITIISMIFKLIFIFIIFSPNKVIFFVRNLLRETSMREYLGFVNLWERSFFLIDTKTSVNLIF